MIPTKFWFPSAYKPMVAAIPKQLNTRINITVGIVICELVVTKPILPVYKNSCISIIVNKPKLKSNAPKAGLLAWRLIITPKPINTPASKDFFVLFIKISFTIIYILLIMRNV